MISSVNIARINPTSSNGVKSKKSIRNNTISSQVKTNEKNNDKKPVSGVMSLISGTYFASKAVTSGLRRILGVRLETHTTTRESAKNIIKNGCILDPKYSGNGASKVLTQFGENSKGFVHITGMHNTAKKQMENSLKLFFGDEIPNKANKILNKLFDTPLRNVVRNLYRKFQKKIYVMTSTLDMKNSFNDIDEMDNFLQKNFGNKKKIVSNLFDMITNRKSKTFYVGGTDKYFNENFIPDINDLALKTDKPLKVSKTKISAIFKALKRDGLSGLKQNKSRVAFGLCVTLACGTIAYKLIKSGIKKLGIIKKGEDINNKSNS